VSHRLLALAVQESSQASQVVQDSAAYSHMDGELAEVITNQPQRLFPAQAVVSRDSLDFGLYLVANLFDGFGQQAHILVGAFNAVEWSFSFVTHVLREPRIEFLPRRKKMGS
jgi:hypothetical protein